MADLICPNCSSTNPPDNLFCQSCGFSLKGVKPVAGDKTVMAPRATATPPSLPEKKTATPPSPPPPILTEKTPPPPAPRATPPPASPPPPPPSFPPVPTAYIGTPIQKMGIKNDSWYELLPGEGERAEELSALFKAEVEAAAPKGVRLVDSLLNGGGSPPRTYHLITNGMGATVAARFSALGKDLYAGWDLFIKREINWVPVILIGSVAFLLAIINAVLSGIATNFFYALLNFFQVFLELILVPGLALLLLGKLVKDDIWGFFFKNQDAFKLDEANALSLLVDDALSRAIEQLIAAPPKKKK